jgi:hypothetical protein
MFAASVKKQVPVDDGRDKGVVTIRKLSARSLDKAREARQIAAAALTSKFDPNILKVYRETGRQPDSDAPVDKYAAYDRDAVLQAGIDSWTFDVSIEEGLKDIDEPTAELLFHEIIDLSDPTGASLAQAEKKAPGAPSAS